MNVIKESAAARGAVQNARARGMRVGFVPTMGALHAGHMSLVQAAKAQCDIVAVSIFVNPTQFGPTEDFSRYPRPLEADLAMCQRASVDLVFTPALETMYPPGAETKVGVGKIGEILCGAFRPGHFDGVATIVAKLFNILPADAAFFGEKDYQQLIIIRRMARDLDFPIEIVGCPTVREADGLAMSSRNVYLSKSERLQARSLSASLFAARDSVNTGGRDSQRIAERIRKTILQAGPAEIDYIAVVDPDDLHPIPHVEANARICLAVRIGSTRLIDNVLVIPNAA